jgi:spore maturation protein CgeB
MKDQHHNVRYLGFSPYEKPRSNPALSARKFMKGVAQKQAESIFAYASPLSIEEIRYVQASGIPLASNTVGLGSFFVGGASSQAEAMDILRGYNWYFVSHAPHVPRLREEGINAFSLPMAYDPRWFHPLDGIEQKYDILFVGDIFTPLNNNRGDLLRHISQKFRVAVMSYKPTGIPGIHHLPSEVNPYRLNRVLNQAKIALGSDRIGDVQSVNNHPEQYIFYEDEFYLRQRAYVMIGAGCCYMVERHPEIARQFEDRKELILWDDYDELTDQLAYYRTHDEERRAVGQAGHRRALSQYTAAHMMQFVFETMGLLPIADQM